MPSPRKLKIFVASPSDVQEERETLARLVAEVNDTLAYLVPEKGLSLELVRYETHSYPDIGKPQDVIDREIPVDYDIFVGVMWKRAGTPTSHDPSGTISEFRRACEKRKTSALPRIMFYFCEQPIPMPTAADIEQLEAVVKFKSELQAQGLTSSYPSHGEFGEHIRGGLLRAIRDILRDTDQVASAEVTVTPTDDASLGDAQQLADEYEEVRRKMQASDERTSRMALIFGRMKSLAPRVRGSLLNFEQSTSPGNRLMAVAVLTMFPSADHLDWLSERLDPANEKPFVGYHSAVALLEAVNSLPTDFCPQLKAAVTKATTLGGKNQSDRDRLLVLVLAAKELARKCAK
jgi:hypothetical protein